MISFWVCFGVSALNVVLALAMNMPGMRRAPEKTQSARGSGESTFASMFDPAALPFAAVTFFMTFAYSGVSAFLALYARELNLMDAAGNFPALLRRFPDDLPYFHRARLRQARLPLDSLPQPLLFHGRPGPALAGKRTRPDDHFRHLHRHRLRFRHSHLQAQIICAVPSHKIGTAALFFNAMDAGLAIGAYIMGITVDLAGYRSIYAAGAIVVLLAGVLYTAQMRGRPAGQKQRRAAEQQ